MIPATNKPIAAIINPTGPVANLKASPKPLIASDAAFVTAVHTTVAAEAILVLRAWIVCDVDKAATAAL